MWRNLFRARRPCRRSRRCRWMKWTCRVSINYSKTGRSGVATHMEVKTTLLEQLRALRLPAFREGFEETARKAMQETPTYEQYLLELTHQGGDERRGRGSKRGLRET